MQFTPAMGTTAAKLSYEYFLKDHLSNVSTNDANYKLFVQNGIRTRKVKIEMDTWPDCVLLRNTNSCL